MCTYTYICHTFYWIQQATWAVQQGIILCEEDQNKAKLEAKINSIEKNAYNTGSLM